MLNLTSHMKYETETQKTGKDQSLENTTSQDRGNSAQLMRSSLFPW